MFSSQTQANHQMSIVHAKRDWMASAFIPIRRKQHENTGMSLEDGIIQEEPTEDELLTAIRNSMKDLNVSAPTRTPIANSMMMTTNNTAMSRGKNELFLPVHQSRPKKLAAENKTKMVAKICRFITSN
jgi:5,10-methylene-tetrahydrofolate dehydrogenase/methenyl tetrahydrofolate cyclohydrolase